MLCYCHIVLFVLFRFGFLFIRVRQLFFHPNSTVSKSENVKLNIEHRIGGIGSNVDSY